MEKSLIDQIAGRRFGTLEISRGTPLYEQAQDALWQKILSGEIEPGQHLSDRVLAQQLSVSRTPVREAMRQMAREGVLDTIGSGGYRVTPVNREGLIELYACRAALAGVAVEEATTRKDTALLAALREIIARKARALAERDISEIFELSGHFHDRIIDSSTNAFLRQTMAPLGRLIQFYRFALLRRSLDFEGLMDAYVEHFKQSHSRHQRIIEAMEAGDGLGAGRLMVENLRTSAMDMDTIFSRSQVGPGA